jgi:hypothetical protein
VRDLESYVQRREDQDREAAAAVTARTEEPSAAPSPAVGVQWTVPYQRPICFWKRIINSTIISMHPTRGVAENTPRGQ